MAHGSKAVWLGLLILASGASATTLGPLKGRPVTGHPLELNVPFAVDDPRDKACASANVRYGSAPAPRPVLHVQGHGLNRNLLLTSRANVSGEIIIVNVRIGCGTKAVTRRFTMLTTTPTARSPAVARPVTRRAAADVVVRAAPRPVSLAAPAEPLFPPPVAEALPQENVAQRPDASAMEDLRKARTDAAAALAELDATRKELAAVLDVERRTQQTLINSDHQVRDAQSEVAHMRAVLKWVGAVLSLGAAGLVWWEFNRLASRRRTTKSEPPQEPVILFSGEMPATGAHS